MHFMQFPLNPTQLFIFALSTYLISAVSGLILVPRKVPTGLFRTRLAGLGISFVFLASAIASLANLMASYIVLSSREDVVLSLFDPTPFGQMTFRIDPLSAFFLLIISLVGLAVSIYSLGYVRSFLLKRHVGVFLFLYSSFLLLMSTVVTIANGVFFLVVWEGMSIATFFLITYEHESKSSRRAGFLYVIMAHIGTLFLILMFLTFFSYCRSFDFESFRSAASSMPWSSKSVVFFCALIGFGIKSGVIPLHIWLPEAHPAAPSNISALMSGVMIKTGIYGMVRVLFDFLGTGLPWWGFVVLILALGSSVLGVLFALMEHDLKRLLAYHSIENIGIILMGIAVALIFHAAGNDSIAYIGLVAALFHTLNHATFKSLLFLAAGSVVHSTGTRNIEDLGGLMKRLPYTASFFLIGAIAISALPPLNGFISEWLTFQAFFRGFDVAGLSVKIAMPIGVALLALTSALAAACFVKAFGITFLGLGRSHHVDTAHESPWNMLAGMGMLSVACLAFGLAPSFVISLLQPVADFVLHRTSVGAHPAGLSTTISTNSTMNDAPILVAILLLVIASLVVFGIVVLRGNRKTRIVPTWACGLENISPRMQYTATGFSKPIRMIFSSVFRPSREIDVIEPMSPYFKPTIRVDLRTEAIFDTRVYQPLLNYFLAMLRVFRKIQTGDLQSYLAYIFVTLIILLWLAL
jgi:hydrogenase-4 component B